MTKATSPQLAPGTVIDGMYTIGESLRSRLGAVTYAASDPNDKKVAVTVYRADCFMNAMALERALRELRQVSTVDDPRVIHVFDSGKLKDGGIYEVHEHVEGKTLGELGQVSSDEARKILSDTVAALKAAGAVGVLHRGLGPDAVLRAEDDSVKVGGFAVGEPQGGVSFGAIECIAPEQVEGKNLEETTLVYNLGALGYRLLHGRPLFIGDLATQLLQHAASVPPGDVDPALQSSLSKDPKARPAGLAAFEAQLAEMRAPAAPSPVSKGIGFGPIPGAKTPIAGPKIARPPGLGLPGAKPGLGPLPGARPGLAAPGGLGAPKPAVAGPPLASGAAAAAKPAAKPRTRGWTMFMEATDDEVGPAAKSTAAPAAPAPAVTPGAAVKASVGAPALAPSFGAPLAAPSFGAPSVAAPPVAAPPVAAPVATSPVAAPPVAAPSFGGPVAPSFGLSAPPLAAPPLGGPPVSAPSLGVPAAAAAPAPAPLESKPSVRGWTMIMDDPDEAAAATPVVAVAPAAAPSTRGWTMLEELNESPPVEVGAGVPMPAEQAAATAAPTSRGWTMFMEAELEGEKQAPEPVAEPEPEFYEGALTTDSGTVVAYAPEAPTSQPKPKLGEDLMTSFASRLRAEEEPVSSFASRLRADEEEPAEESLEQLAQATTGTASAPQPVAAESAPVPSFAGASSLPLVPTKAPELSPTAPSAEALSDSDELNEGGGNRLLWVGVALLVLAAVAYLVLR